MQLLNVKFQYYLYRNSQVPAEVIQASKKKALAVLQDELFISFNGI